MPRDFDWSRFLEEAEKKKVSSRLPPTWRPEKPGDRLYGVVVDVRPNPWDKTATTLIIRTPDGREFMTPRNQVLLSLIDYWQPKVGAKILIEYEGEGVRKPGKNPPKNFSMYVENPGEARQEEVSVEEAEAEIVTAEEVEEAEKPEKELDAAADYVEECLRIYGALHQNKLEKLLQQKGFKVSVKDVLRLGVFEADKYGYIRRREEK